MKIKDFRSLANLQYGWLLVIKEEPIFKRTEQSDHEKTNKVSDTYVSSAGNIIIVTYNIETEVITKVTHGFSPIDEEEFFS